MSHLVYHEHIRPQSLPPQRPTSSMATPLNSVVPFGHVFKHMSLWGLELFKTPQISDLNMIEYICFLSINITPLSGII